MLDRCESMCMSDCRGPPVKIALSYLFHMTTVAASKVVVVALPANQVRGFARIATDGVDKASADQLVQRAVDGGKTCGGAVATLERHVQLLRRDRLCLDLEGAEYSVALLGAPPATGSPVVPRAVC